MIALPTTTDGYRLARPFQESLFAMSGMALVAMLVALDQTIVGTALPQIVKDLGAFDLYAWVATSYMLTSVIAIPVFGRLGDLVGRKTLLLGAIVLFTAASLLCGFADSMLHLVVARGVQGLGGGIMTGTIFATVADLFPNPASRLRWQVIVSSAFGAGNIVGPILGGVLVQYCNWRLVFFVNLPIGIAALLFIYRFLPHMHRARRPDVSRLDWFGACVLILTLGALLLLIEFLPREGITELTMQLGLIVAIGGPTLWFWERRVADPIIPIAILVDRRLAALFVMSALGGFGTFSLLFNVPLLFQGGFGMSSAHSGMLITPLVVGVTVGTVVNNRLIARVKRTNLTMCAGFALFIIACLSVVAITGKMPHLVWMTCMGVGGIGLGLVASGLSIFSQQIIARTELGAATGVLQSLRTLGGMLGIAVTCSLLNHLYTGDVHNLLHSYQAMQWFKSFASPTLTVDRTDQAVLVNQLVFAGHAGNAIIGSARDALISAIHMGLALAAGAALIGLCLTWFVPPLRISRPGAH
jgi:EmrB/QacA subfamily drug resistance transporter